MSVIFNIPVTAEMQRNFLPPLNQTAEGEIHNEKCQFKRSLLAETLLNCGGITDIILVILDVFAGF